MDPSVPDDLAAFAKLLERGGDEAVMIVVAHPDDETIGIGGQLPKLGGATIVHVTDGAPRDLADARAYGFTGWQDYAAARRAELETAMAEAGVAPDRLIAFGIPDQQAANAMPALARRLAALLRERAPRFVLTHPFEGGHPDHDAIAFAVRAACRMLEAEGLRPPAVIEMASYHAGPDGPVFQDFAAEPAEPVLEIRLDGETRARKARMMALHATQAPVLAYFTASTERFRLAPPYDFSEMPNGGRLHYETLPFGFDGGRWRELASRAIGELGPVAP